MLLLIPHSLLWKEKERVVGERMVVVGEGMVVGEENRWKVICFVVLMRGWMTTNDDTVLFIPSILKSVAVIQSLFKIVFINIKRK